MKRATKPAAESSAKSEEDNSYLSNILSGVELCGDYDKKKKDV